MERLRQLLARESIDCFGVCRFRDIFPLLPCRALSRIPELSRSVIVLLLPYDVGPREGANLARYAWVRDYHTVAGALLGRLVEELQKLHPGEKFSPFVDNSPLREVTAANLAGLGWVGRNSLLLNPHYGGRVFIASVVTTLELPVSPPMPARCLGCGKCAAACPTQAIGESFIRRELCRSHITQKKGELTPWEAGQIRAGGLVWGCDICLDACPQCQNRPTTPLREFREGIDQKITPENADRLLREKAFGYRGRGVIARNYEIIYGVKL